MCKTVDSEHMYMFTSLILLVLVGVRSVGVLLFIVFANCLNKCSMCWEKPQIIDIVCIYDIQSMSIISKRI